MLSEEVLMGVAGVAIALIGFSGVVTALGRRGTGLWSPSELLNLRTLVEPALVALFGAFAPIVFALGTADQEIVWRASNGVLIVGHVVGIFIFYRRGSSTTIRPSHMVVTAIGIATIVGMLLSLLGYFGMYQLTFLLGLLLAILASVHNFYLLLFSNPGDAD